jgi:hypothetical protein
VASRNERRQDLIDYFLLAQDARANGFANALKRG